MPFSKTPQTSTYQTKQVTLVNEWETRDVTSTKDADNINCFVETFNNRKIGDREKYIVKRDGCASYYTAASSTIRGMHYWKDQDKLFIATGTDIAIVTASTGALVTTLAGAFATSSGDVGFCEFLFTAATTKICATDGTTLITIDSANTKVVVTDIDLPSPHLPYPVFLDGYLFLVKTNTADIYNSNLDDPTAWTSGDFITAEMSADKLVRIDNINNYIIAFGNTSMEYFFDAANASGSPLQRYEAPFRNIGYVSGYARFGNKRLFVGSSGTSTQQIYMMEDLKVEPIAVPPARRAAEANTNSKAAVFSFGGHDFYNITLGSLSYMLDLDTKLWSRTQFQNTTSMSTPLSLSFEISGIGIVSVFAITGSASLYYFKNTLYQDAGTNFTTTVVTDNDMFDTYRRKTGSRLLVICDKPSSTANMGVSWSDDDYQTWSTERNVDVSLSTPMLTQLGQFRRRAHKLTWTQNLPMRLFGIELDLNLDQS